MVRCGTGNMWQTLGNVCLVMHFLMIFGCFDIDIDDVNVMMYVIHFPYPQSKKISQDLTITRLSWHWLAAGDEHGNDWIRRTSYRI